MHPYKRLPDRNFWSKAVTGTPWSEMFMKERGRFTITRADLVASAGSCFAQRIAHLFHAKGFPFPSFEPPHPLLSPEDAAEFGYGPSSARCGNIYTIPELLQLIDQALGRIEPKYLIRQNHQGAWVDLLRPSIKKGGFITPQEAEADRFYHLGRVREMFTKAHVFVFTMGLTETWLDEASHTFFGIHPEVALGVDPDLAVERVNLDYNRCYKDLSTVIQVLRSINPGLRFIFTVSPVALAATHQDRHVLLATTYSKAVLRAVAGKIVEDHEGVDYFMSYEIFNAVQSFGQFLSDDLRDIHGRGLGTVMNTFAQMYFAQEGESQDAPLQGGTQPEVAGAPKPLPADPGTLECDEIMNALF